MIPDALREFAETPGRFSLVPDESSVNRFADGRVCVIQGPTWASVAGINVEAGEVDDLVAEVGGLIPAGKETEWMLGPSTLPADLEELLIERGFHAPPDRTPLVCVVALTEEPPRQDAIQVDRVTGFEQFRAMRELAWEAFETPEGRRDLQRQRLSEDFEESMRDGIPVDFIATIDEVPAGAATAIPSERGVFLVGGSTASWARGRGVYRALVRARWDYAVGRDTPALVTHAVPTTSYPILRRLGFEDVCQLRRLNPPAAST